MDPNDAPAAGAGDSQDPGNSASAGSPSASGATGGGAAAGSPAHLGGSGGKTVEPPSGGGTQHAAGGAEAPGGVSGASTHGGIGGAGGTEQEPHAGGEAGTANPDLSEGERDGDHSNSNLDFLPGRGFYESPVDVTVDHPTAAQMAYTLDASDPRSSATATVVDLPATIRIDPLDTSDRYLSPGVVLRAVELPIEDDRPDLVATHTYLFATRIVELSPDGSSPGSGWPDPRPPSRHSGEQSFDYGMDPEVCEAPEYASEVVPAMLALPSISLVTELPNLFDSTSGIFVNAEERGRDWERPCSAELLNPDASRGFQVNCGLRIRGGYSRHGGNPKHAFRLFFRGDYGATKLRFPLFGDEGTDTYDKVDLRTSGNYSWSFETDERNRTLNTMNRDVFSRDLQRELGRPYTRSRYYHLYLDGVYWGIFQTQERADANFGDSYLGGDDDDYDVVKSNKVTENVVEIEFTDGTEETWREIWDRCEEGFADDAAYYELEGRLSDGTRDPNLPVHVDIGNLIDFMLVIFYTGNFDGPTTSFLRNQMPNNFFAMKNRSDTNQGFAFFTHDNEHTLLIEPTFVSNGIDEDRVNIGSIDYFGIMSVNGFSRFHPQWLHQKLTENASYRARFAARAQEVLEGTGVMTPERAKSIFRARRVELEMAIVAESARWGDAQADSGSEVQAMTKDDHWTVAVDRIENEFFEARTAIVIEQLRAADLYP